MILSPENSSRILDRLRAAAIAGQFAAITAALWLFGNRLPGAALLAAASAFAIWHLWGRWRRGQGRSLTESRLTAEVLVDVGAISVLLSLAGGWTNPFVSIYLVPVGFAAAVLPAPRALLVAAAAFCGYLVNVFVFVPLPIAAHATGTGFNLHLVGMLISFVLAGVILLGTVLVVRRAYDEERAALAREREARLRDEQLLSLGVLAASTAHELGTPLSTARMLVEAIEEEGRASPADLGLLRDNLDQASDTLQRLAGVAQRGDDTDLTVHAFCSQVADRFRTLRPDIDLNAVTDLDLGLGMRGSGLLESAVLSLLINAATASSGSGRDRVDFDAGADGEWLSLRIRDYGGGFAAAGAAAAPTAGNGSRHEARGLGVGLVISSATLERYGGSARHYARDPGTEVVVTLPLRRLGQVR